MVPRPYQLPTAAVIVDVHQENSRTRTFTLDACLDAYPGQFVMVWQPRFDEKPFSLVSADPVRLMVTAVGPFSKLLHQAGPGDRFWIRGPFGHGFEVPDQERNIVLVGGGYGVAPLYWLARSQQGHAARVLAIVGARTAEDVLYARHFQDLGTLSTQRGSGTTQYELAITTEDGSLGHQGVAVDPLLPRLEAEQVDGIYACGPHGMLAALAALSQHYRVPAQLSWEAYMRCGIGICGACEHEGKLLCMDGPVLAQ